MRTIVYIDGFNLYYGCLQATPYKWVDLERLCRLLLPRNDIQVIKYFTAKVGARQNDPDQPVRQQTFLRALATLPSVQVFFGHFLSNKVMLPKADGSGFVEVIRTEEKGSDVNLAAHFIADAYDGNFDAAVLVTCDSDLLYPMQLVAGKLKKPVGLLPPRANRAAQLTRVATFQKSIRTGVLAASQLSDELTDANGTFRRPWSWYPYEDRINTVVTTKLTTPSKIAAACHTNQATVQTWMQGTAVPQGKFQSRLNRHLVPLEALLNSSITIGSTQTR